MIYDIITIFPEFFKCLEGYGLIGKAIEEGIIEVNPVNLRDYSENKHKKVDDDIYGPGAGMLMTPGPIFNAVEDLKKDKAKVIFLSPQGRPLDQELAIELGQEEHLILLCGHYEGVDQRVIDQLIDLEVSIGDYVVTGGEIPAMILIDSISRFIPGVVGNEDSLYEDSLYDGLLKHPMYTRPFNFRGMEVPEVLVSGNHALIEEWQREKSLEVTREKRPDLYKIYKEKDKS